MTDRDQLAALGVEGLTRLLGRRPDAVAQPVPRTLDELAQRLDSPTSVLHALESVTLAHLQLLSAAVALGPDVDVVRLGELLGADPSTQLTELAELGLVHPAGTGRIRVADGVQMTLPDWLDLGPPFAVVVDRTPQRALQTVERALGLPTSKSRAAAIAALSAFYADADRVRSRLDDVDPSVAKGLITRAWGETAYNDDAYDDDLDDDLDGDGFEVIKGAGSFRIAYRFDQRQEVDRAGVDLGLMIGTDGWPATAVMPAEVALALRGPDYRAPFHPDPPTVARLPLSRLGPDVAAAVTAFDASATAVLDNVAAHPVAVVVAGGVGAREITRLARSTRVPEPTVRMVLELADTAGLLARSRPVTVSPEFAAWRDAEPAERYVALALAWWAFDGRPSLDREPDGTVHRALTGPPCVQCRMAHVGLVDVLATDTGLSPLDAARLATWQHPTVHAGNPPFGPAWDEAVLVGAIAQGARTPIGSALLTGDVDALRAAVSQAMPASTSSAVFGSDLTAFVAGSPSARVSAVLDACADRESGGGAVTWRLSPGSVRRAFDDGWTAPTLLDGLREICAATELPQAVTVLLDDVARSYGRMRVSSAVSVVAFDDEALVAQVLHDRKLASFELTPVAPLVLTSAAEAGKLVAALRKGGYLPAWDGPTAAAPVVVGRPVERAAPVRVTLDPGELARRLLARPKPVEPSQVEWAVQSESRGLSDDEVHLLAAAIEQRHPVGIVYQASTGGVTHRVITPRELLAGHVYAWCALRSDNREFAVARVLEVFGV